MANEQRSNGHGARPKAEAQARSRANQTAEHAVDKTGDPLDLSTNPTLPKGQEIVRIKDPPGSLTLHDRRLFNHLLALAYDDVMAGRDRSKTPITTLRGKHGSTDRLRASLEKLQQTLVQIYRPETKKWSSVQLLGAVKIEHNELTFRFPPEIVAYIINPQQHARINLRVVYHFTSKYALTLYEHLMLFARHRQPEWTVPVDDLREFLGIRPGELSDFAQMRRRAIDPAIKEIEKFAPLLVSYEAVKDPSARRKISAVSFSIRYKTPRELQEAVAAQDQDLPLFGGYALIPQVLDTPETRAALYALADMMSSDRERWFRTAQERQQQHDGAPMLVETWKDTPQVWCHYVAEDLLLAGIAVVPVDDLAAVPAPNIQIESSPLLLEADGEGGEGTSVYE